MDLTFLKKPVFLILLVAVVLFGLFFFDRGGLTAQISFLVGRLAYAGNRYEDALDNFRDVTVKRCVKNPLISCGVQTYIPLEHWEYCFLTAARLESAAKAKDVSPPIEDILQYRLMRTECWDSLITNASNTDRIRDVGKFFQGLSEVERKAIVDVCRECLNLPQPTPSPNTQQTPTLTPTPSPKGIQALAPTFTPRAIIPTAASSPCDRADSPSWNKRLDRSSPFTPTPVPELATARGSFFTDTIPIDYSFTGTELVCVALNDDGKGDLLVDDRIILRVDNNGIPTWIWSIDFSGVRKEQSCKTQFVRYPTPTPMPTATPILKGDNLQAFPCPPQDISFLFSPGRNTVTIWLVDVYPKVYGALPIYLVIWQNRQ